MNITDVEIEGLLDAAKKLYGTEELIGVVFARQRELIAQYAPINAELTGEPELPIPVSLNSVNGQRAIKERAWWATEELAESLDALESNQPLKALEELIDSLHFMTELCIISGLDLSDAFIPEGRTGYRIPEMITFVVQDLGMAMWQLRNKPWKRTQVLTDEARFNAALHHAYCELLNTIMKGFEIDLEQVVVAYLRKSEVNKFRIRSYY